MRISSKNESLNVFLKIKKYTDVKKACVLLHTHISHYIICVQDSSSTSNSGSMLILLKHASSFSVANLTKRCKETSKKQCK